MATRGLLLCYATQQSWTALAAWLIESSLEKKWLSSSSIGSPQIAAGIFIRTWVPTSTAKLIIAFPAITIQRPATIGRHYCCCCLDVCDVHWFYTLPYNIWWLGHWNTLSDDKQFSKKSWSKVYLFLLGVCLWVVSTVICIAFSNMVLQC